MSDGDCPAVVLAYRGSHLIALAHPKKLHGGNLGLMDTKRLLRLLAVINVS